MTHFWEVELKGESINTHGDGFCDDLRLTLKLVLWIGMITQAGDSHFGYFGFRDAADNTKLKDNGAMSVMVNN